MLRRFRRVEAEKAQRTEATFALADGSEILIRMTPHPRARRLRISVGDEGVRVTIPPRVSDRTVDQFIESHLDWIAAKLERFAETPALTVQPFASTQLPLRGEWLDVEWHTGKTDKVWRDFAVIHVQVREATRHDAASATLKRALRDFYLNEARADIARWLPALADAVGHAPVRIGFKRMRTQWGSMSSTGVMALELSLVLGRASAFRYVLVHELCHMVHHDHSPAYWREVERHFPDWKEERDYLHTFGRGMKSSLKAIIS